MRWSLLHRLALPVALPVLLAVAACRPAVPATQEWQADIPLTWADFAGPRPAEPQHDAETTTAITAATWTCPAGSIELVGARAVFDRSTSFVTPSRADPALLRHEQGHFDLTELAARNLRTRLRAIRCADQDAATTQEQVDAIFQEITQGFVATSERYDRQTSHGRDPVRQGEWNQQLRDALAQTAGE